MLIIYKGLIKEGNILFNNALNTFYLLLYGRERNVLFNNALNTFYLLLYGRERNVLFNNALNTFYLRLYGFRHMVEHHSGSERGNPLLTHGLLFPISSKVFFYMHHPIDRITHTTAFGTPVVEHWKREIGQWVHHEGSIRRPIAP